MKLDSEEQREQILGLLGAVTYQVTAGTIDQTKKSIDALFGSIREAEIEQPSSDTES
jgi:hypothetical protein